MASGDGVALYQKDYPDQMPDLVLTINLTQAKILSLHGQVESLGKGQGVLGGDNPTFERRTLADYWEQTVAGEPKLFAMFNGQKQMSNYRSQPHHDQQHNQHSHRALHFITTNASKPTSHY